MRHPKGLLALSALLVALALAVPGADAAPTTMVTLGSASTYAALSGASIGNTVSAPGDPYTTLRGDLGVVANAQPTGFPPGVVTGAFDVGNAAAAQAGTDALAAYTSIAARTGGAPLAGALAGATITPGLYTITGAASNTSTVTLDGQGDPNAVFVFQVGGAMTTAALSHVVLVNGAQASRVFWQVNGAGGIGAGATFAGTMIALDAVAVGHGTVVNGRVLALNGALTLDDNQVYSAPPVVTISGGTTAITTDTTPTISGTTDVTAPALVTVTVNGQTLTTTTLRRGLVGDLGDPGEQRLPDRRLGHRRGREPRQRITAADGRHGAAGRHDRRWLVRDDERPDSDDRRHQRRRGRHDRPRDRRLDDPDRARADRGDMEHHSRRAARQHVRGHRLRHRPRRESGHRQSRR